MISITKVILPMAIFKKTLEFFRKHGEEFLEALALWVGIESSNVFKIKEVWFPNQENSIISYYVSDIDVHLINVKLNKMKYSAIAQIHTHPDDAYHSQIDDQYPILVLSGSFSIVVPDLGNKSVNKILNEMVIYRLISGKWILQPKEEVNEIFKIEQIHH